MSCLVDVAAATNIAAPLAGLARMAAPQDPYAAPQMCLSFASIPIAAVPRGPSAVEIAAAML